MCLRLYQLSKIPRELLEERLGYDIPPVPEISIAGIKSRSVLLCWLNSKHAGFAGAPLSLLCNGIKCKDCLSVSYMIVGSAVSSPQWARSIEVKISLKSRRYKRIGLIL